MTRRLVLLRHGQSQWNLDNRFTGWVDVDLTEQGRREAAAAGRLMREEGLQFDVAHTSVLKRAIHTLQGALAELEQDWLPVNKSGASMSATTAACRAWTRPRPRPSTARSRSRCGVVRTTSRRRRWNWKIRATRSMTAVTAVWTATRCRAPSRWPPPDRVLPYWHDAIAPQLKDGKTVLVTAHGNSLRALYKYLNNVSREEILELNIPTGIPLLFELNDDLTVQSFRYLGDPEAARKAAEAVANRARRNKKQKAGASRPSRAEPTLGCFGILPHEA